MAKYTREEIKLLKVIAELRGLAYELAGTSHKPVGAYDSAFAALAQPKLGAGLPHPEDLWRVGVVGPEEASLTQEFDRGYKAGVKAAKQAMEGKVKEIEQWEVPLLAHEED